MNAVFLAVFSFLILSQGKKYKKRCIYLLNYISNFIKMNYLYANLMIKEIFKQSFPPDENLVFTYKSSSYLDLITKTETDVNLTFEFKVKQFSEPFSGKIIRKISEDYDEYTRFFSYYNQNYHETAFLAIGFQSMDIYKIWDIYVEPSFQSLGIGTELLKHTEKIARQWSAKAIVVEVQSSNFPAIQFFQNHKFLITGFDLVHHSKDDFKKHNFLVHMTKILD